MARICAGALQLLQGAIAALHRPLEDAGQLLAMLGLAEIVQQQDIDAVEPQALIAALDGAHDAVIGIVEDDMEGHERVELGGNRIGIGPALDQPADFRREDEIIPLMLAQHIAHAPLAEPEAVIGRGIEIAAALRPGRLHGPARIRLGNRGEEIAQGRAAEAERRDMEAGAADLARLHGEAPLLAAAV